MTTLAARTRLEGRVPPAGAWRLEAWLASGPVPSPGLIDVVVGDLTFTGSILPGRGGAELGVREQPHVVIVGGAGWQLPLVRAGSYGGAGVKVKLSTVLRDLAALSGEPYDAPADVVLGNAYGWDASTEKAPLCIADVLDDLVTRGAIPTWRITPEGRLRFDAWPSIGPCDAFGRILDRRLGQSVRTMGLDSRVRAFLPGATIEGKPVRYLDLIERDSGLRANIWQGVSPALASIRKVVLALFPWLCLSGFHTYQVELVNSNGTIDCAPTKRGFLAPPMLQRLPAVSQWLAGAEVAPNVGDELLIVYRDNDRGRPAIIAYSPLRSALPVSMKLAGLSGPAALRVGDVRGLVLDPGVPSALSPALYYTADGGTTFVVVAMVVGGSTISGTVPPPTVITTFTPLAPTGSAKVTIS